MKIVLGILAIVFLYFFAAFALTYIPVNSDFKPADKDSVVIYLRSNGVHTDFVVPLKNEIKDWSTYASPLDTRAQDSSARYVSFGWGDKGFYLETPEWSDLKFKTAFKALFCLSSSAMHVVFYGAIEESDRCKKVCITKQQYKKLADYIESGFQLKQGRPCLIPGVSYWDNDAFYEGNGKYSLFLTCNTWTNRGLKAAGMKACLWTPFDKGILYHYPSVVILN